MGSARLSSLHGPRATDGSRQGPGGAARGRDRDRDSLSDPARSAAVRCRDGARAGELPGRGARRARGSLSAAPSRSERRAGRPGVRAPGIRAGAWMKARGATRPRRPLRLILVAGARPNFMKVAPLMRAFRGRPDRFEVRLVHTGQHYDEAMSDVFFQELEIPPPEIHLGVGSGTHAAQTARVMETFEKVVQDDPPDWVVVVGDVNSTLAC